MNETKIIENYFNSNISYTIPENFFNITDGFSFMNSRYPLWTAIVIIIVASILSIITVIGNCMVMISFKIDKQLQTISNYFLFSLAVADFAIGLISMPLFTVYTVLGYWPLGSHICDTWLALDYLASNASVLNLLIISFDRYFSVTRPLTYRAKRTTLKAGIMIACAWGISILLWPPWIYSWPYIEGERTVPDNACYIQFIETNHYITFGTAIAAFYVPVTVMIILYWRIWQETEKRQKDLPNLQAGKQDASKRSNSSDEALDIEVAKQNRSESKLDNEDINRSSTALSYIDKHYTHHKLKHRVLSWKFIKIWCIAWWHSGREDEDDDDDDEELAGMESSRSVHVYDDTLTPISVETPLTTISRCPSFSMVDTADPKLSTAIQDCEYIPLHSDTCTAATMTGRSITSDSIYTIVIRLPAPQMSMASSAWRRLDADVPSIKMYREGFIDFHEVHSTYLKSGVTNRDDNILCLNSSIKTAKSLSNQQAQIADVRIPFHSKNDMKIVTNKGVLGKVPIKKKKKLQEKKADKKAAKTLSAILAAFIITWTPYNILVLLKPLTACTGCIPQELWDFFYYLCYINSTVNPVCYALCNATFRRTYVRIFKCKWHTRNRTAVNRGY